MSDKIIVLGNAPTQLMDEMWKHKPTVYGCNYRVFDLFHQYEAVGMCDTNMLEFYIKTVQQKSPVADKIRQTKIYVPKFPEHDPRLDIALANAGAKFQDLDFNFFRGIPYHYNTGAQMINLALQNHPEDIIHCIGFDRNYKGDYLGKLPERTVNRLHEHFEELGYINNPQIFFH